MVQAESALALLDGGAQPNLKDARKTTALDVARENGAQPIAALLESRGGKPGSEVKMRDLKPPRALGVHRVPRVLGWWSGDARFAAAQARARETLPEFLRLAREHPGRASAVFTLGASAEHVFGDVTAIEPDAVRVRLDVARVSTAAPSPDRVPLSAVEDWRVDLPEGAIRGAFSLRAMLALAREEYGALPQYLLDEEGRLVDPPAF